jgi:D-glycero-D-manno-heptose 1,7-bisphosphate phosphatase
MDRAIFLDRDGVLNPNVFNPLTGCWESPHRPADFRLKHGVVEALKRLQDAGYSLFVVSNQPSYAKGKTSLENILSIAGKLREELSEAGIYVARYYYCFHHPDGVVPGFSGPCVCRKPSPYFLKEAEREFALDLRTSWMVGDRASDIACGRQANVQPILVRPDHPDKSSVEIHAYAVVDDLAGAADVILGSIPVKVVVDRKPGNDSKPLEAASVL